MGGARRRPGTGRSAAQAALALTLPLLAAAFLFTATAHADFGFKSLGLKFTEENGSAARQAGSHPFAWTTDIAFNTTAPPNEIPDGMIKDLRIHLPPGLVGTPSLVPRCEHADLYREEPCSAASQVGSVEIDAEEPGGFSVQGKTFGVYNLVPEPGEAAELGINVSGGPVVIFDIEISPQPPYELIASLSNVTQIAYVFGFHLTLNGVVSGAPFLTLPPSCAPASSYFEADRWNQAGVWVTDPAPEMLQLDGCNRLSYRPTVSAAPTTAAADAPSGIDFSFSSPLEGLTSATGLAEADTERASFTLPPGMDLNPALANGLAACSSAELANETLHSLPGEGCPQAAKIGTAEIASPVLDETIPGTIFAAAPASSAGDDSPFGLDLVLRDARRGILIKQSMRIEADSQSGRLTAVIPEIPQLPFSRFDLHLRGGPRGPLTTPTCGSHAINYSLTPSSGAPPLQGQTHFATNQSCHTAAPFSPRLVAGTVNPVAGGFSPLSFELLGDDGEANPERLSLTLPAGLSADFAAVPTCPESLVASGACPAASSIGQATIALGPGPEPLWVPEPPDPPSPVYLAGAYHGAPYSLLAVLPAQAGPYELGTELLRAPIFIDPETAQASVQLEALPQIFAGVPLHYRAIRLLLDRPGFIRNPTSCEPTRISATATAADGSAAKLASRFQVGDCAALRFSPKLALSLSKGLGRDAHPALRAVLHSAADEAGIAAANFTLPAGELLDIHHLRDLCARDLSPERCPGGSRLGRARLWSPMLSGPLEGPIYLRTPAGRLPDLLADLRHGQLRLLLHGHTGAPGGRLRVGFDALPDFPISKAVFTLAGARQGIFVNSEALCASPRRAQASLSAHNGRRRELSPRLHLQGSC